MGAARQYPARLVRSLCGHTCLHKYHYFLSAATKLLIWNVLRWWFWRCRRTLRTPFFATRPLWNGWLLSGPSFSPAGAWLWKSDSWPEFFRFARRVWCDGSYGAAHNRFSSDQKWLVNQLDFNNFVSSGAVRNITCIFCAGFSFILDKTFFFMPSRALIFHWNLHVQILTCFAQLFWLFCFGMCFAMFTPERFSIVMRPL